MAPQSHSSIVATHRGKYGLGRLSSSRHRIQGAFACRLRSRATLGDWGGVKAPLTAWAACARAPVGKHHSGSIQGSGSSFASPASHRHPESGGAARTLPVCRKWRALLSGCRWRVAARLNPL